MKRSYSLRQLLATIAMIALLLGVLLPDIKPSESDPIDKLCNDNSNRRYIALQRVKRAKQKMAQQEGNRDPST